MGLFLPVKILEMTAARRPIDLSVASITYHFLSTWHYHTGHPGGYRATTWGVLVKTKPEALFHHVVKGMLPRNRLKYASKLKVYAGATHPHSAQNPETLEI